MASLTAHLRRPDDHGRLAFHPECPLCCGERLAGALPPEAFVGRRTQALLTAGVLAFSSATPTVVLAAEPVQETEGATAPDQATADDAPSAPEFDPGGKPTDLPFNAVRAAPALPTPAAEDTIPLEQEPATDEVAPTADPGDGTGTPGADQQRAPQPTDPAQAPASVEPAAPPPPTAPTIETPAATPAVPEPVASAPSRERKPETGREKRRSPRATAPQIVRADTVPHPEPVTAVSAPTTARPAEAQPASRSSAVVSSGRAARRGDRVHVVQRGESLWSIAGDLLGDGASVARIAREVNRLWELNGDRIGTGDRDLLVIGTRLALR